MPDSIRIDRWLWAVRIYKSRSQAGTACRLNQVKIDHQFVKPSRTVTVGTTIEIERDQMTRQVTVELIAEKRISPKLVADHYTDVTPDEELERARAAREQLRLNRVYQVPGEGRPSKKHRREIEKFLDVVEQSTNLDQIDPT